MIDIGSEEFKLFTEGVKCEQCGVEKEVAFNPHFEMTLCRGCWHVLSEQKGEGEVIAIKVELWPFGDKSKAKTIGRMYIANDGTGSKFEGDYDIKVTDGSEPELSGGYEFRELEATKARVDHHDRKLGFWPIVYRAIGNIMPNITRFK